MIPEGANERDIWERVIVPTIMGKYQKHKMQPQQLHQINIHEYDDMFMILCFCCSCELHWHLFYTLPKYRRRQCDGVTNSAHDTGVVSECKKENCTTSNSSDELIVSWKNEPVWTPSQKRSAWTATQLCRTGRFNGFNKLRRVPVTTSHRRSLSSASESVSAWSLLPRWRPLALTVLDNQLIYEGYAERWPWGLMGCNRPAEAMPFTIQWHGPIIFQ